MVLPINDFNSLLEDFEDLAIAAERRTEENIPHRKVLQDLKKDVLI